MIALAEKERCTGCTACYNACPQGAIKMQANTGGFLYPLIDSKKCIECKACVRVCPVLCNSKLKTDIHEAYIGKSKDSDLLMNCASGGVFGEIAKSFIRNSYIVYGAAFDDELKVKHIRCESLDELKKTFGSKYVQSDLGETFKQIKDDLNTGKKVLFCGTPCQVSGLRAFIGDTDNSLLTIDFLCHSVGSPEVFEKYKKYQGDRYNGIKDIKFKSKKYGYSFPTMEITSLDGRRHYTTSQNDPYMALFLTGRISRDSCKDCHYRMTHLSDITLADCYSGKYNDILSDKNGICRIIVWNEYGSKMINDLKNIISINPVDKEFIFTKADYRNHNTDALEFDSLKSMDNQDFYKMYFRISWKRRLVSHLRFFLQRIGLQDQVKKFIKYRIKITQ